MLTCCKGKPIQFLTHGIANEVERTEEEPTLFRGNSVYASFISVHLRNIGKGNINNRNNINKH